MDVREMFARMWKLGHGDQPKVSIRCYRKVERIVRASGERGECLLLDLLDLADGKDRPGTWFRMVVVDRFRQNGFLVDAPGRQRRTKAKVDHMTERLADTFNGRPEQADGPSRNLSPLPGESHREAFERLKREKKLAGNLPL